MRTLEHVELRRRLDEDGMTLPNGRALGASEAAWRDLLGLLSAGDWTTTWPSGDGRHPSTMAELADDSFASALVAVSPSFTVVLYPSWGTDEVWFDFDAREMRTQEDADALSDFVRTLGRVSGHTVELSYEGCDDDVFAAYDPGADQFRWTD